MEKSTGFYIKHSRLSTYLFMTEHFELFYFSVTYAMQILLWFPLLCFYLTFHFSKQATKINSYLQKLL